MKIKPSKFELCALCALCVGTLAMALVANQYPNPNRRSTVIAAPTGVIHTNMEKPDFNRITKENEWYAAFAPLEVYGSQVTQHRAGRIFRAGTDAPSEAEIEAAIVEAFGTTGPRGGRRNPTPPPSR